jgi:hypothetical protein
VRDIRPQLIAVAAELLHNHARCIYTESGERWEWHAFPTPHFPFESDCSGTVTAICYWAHGNDPSGVNFAYGDTTSILAHAQAKKLIIPKAKVLDGDLILFGLPETVHVVMSLQDTATKPNPLCFSMGKPGDPSVAPLSAFLPLGTPTYVRNVTRVQ